MSRGTTARDARSPHGLNDPRRYNPSHARNREGRFGQSKIVRRRWNRYCAQARLRVIRRLDLVVDFEPAKR